MDSELKVFKMDATEMEINSFVVKLKQLWKSGLSFHLDLDCSEGKAWVGLRLQLGEAPSSYHFHRENFQAESKSSPLKSRRRRKRESFDTVTQSNDESSCMKVFKDEVQVVNNKTEDIQGTVDALNMEIVQDENGVISKIDFE